MLAVGRIINGLSVGICSAQVPVYISELAPPSKRGRLVGFQQWAITWGIMIMFFICYGSSFLKGTAAFRLPWGLQMIPAILLYFGLCLMPESPRWLAKRDRWGDAKDVLDLIHADTKAGSDLSSLELQEIRSAVNFERQNADVSYFELLKPNMINRTSIGVFMQIWSQLTGMNVMVRQTKPPHRQHSSGHPLTCPSRCTTSPTSSPWRVLPREVAMPSCSRAASASSSTSA